MIAAVKEFLFGILIYLGLVAPTPYVAPPVVIIPTSTLVPTPTVKPIGSMDFSVPFTSQSPFGEWSDPRQQDGCEEASVFMAVYWARNMAISDKQYAKDVLLKMYDYEVANWGSGTDTSAADTASRLLVGYFDYENYKILQPVSSDDIVKELGSGNIVIVPTNGKLLFNPNFTGGGPDRHMLVVKGYDVEKRQFITNDPGTRQGANYRYDQDVLFGAIRDYLTGDHRPILQTNKMMISVAPAGN